jgi:Domain of unknown function (DUF4268)
MTKPSLGKLETVDLRAYWEDEAREFTPWLAEPENIKLLGDAVGLELEVQAQEKDVGPFRADILCKDTENNNWVIIENQLEATNHSHLGQLLTYAAGLHASAIIWISERFRPEHRAALDWLNETTREGAAFYGVELELLRIGNSAPAPRFNVVSKPNQFSKEALTGVEGEADLSETKRTQLAFWTDFREYLKAKSRIIRPTKPFPLHWMTHSIGKSGCNLSSVASFWDSEANREGGELRAEVVLGGQHAKSYFEQLIAEKEKIEKEVGAPLKWHNPPDKQMCRIYIRRTADLTDRSKWIEYEEWLRTNLEALYRSFNPRLKAVNPAVTNSQIEAENEEP